VHKFTGVAHKEIGQGKSFILSRKVMENEFCTVEGPRKQW